MQEGNATSNSRSTNVCRRVINYIMNIFTSQSCRNGNVAGNEVIIDFRHIERSSDRYSLPPSGGAGATTTTTNGTVGVAMRPGNKEDYTLINNRQKKRSKEVKLSPAGIQGNGTTRLLINIEEGDGRRKSRLSKRDEIEDTMTTTFKSRNSVDRITSNINEQADAFIRSRREAMFRNYYSSTNHK